MTGEILIGGEKFPIPWPVNHDLHFSGNHFSSRSAPPSRIVLHHDVCFDAKMCHHVLEDKGISTHFCIDNDGTIFQFLDPATSVCWAQGAFNGTSIGIDVSNAVELKFASRYASPRPVLRQVINGMSFRAMGPYPVQEEALADLCALLCSKMGIRASVPLKPTGDPLLEKIEAVPMGIVGHLHLTAEKWDPFGLDWNLLQDRLSERTK
jgi:hypothetical protein